MNTRRLTIIGTTLILVLLLTGCEEYATYTPSAMDLTRIATEWPDDDPAKPTVQAIALQRYGTEVAAKAIAEQAQLTVDAANAQAGQQRIMLTAESGLTAEALNVRATIDALNVQATREAMAIEATRTAEARIAAEMATRDAVQATATQQAYNAQATTDARNATATVISATAQAAAAHATETLQAHKDNVTLTAISATAQAVTLQAKQEQFLYPVKIAGSILLVLAGALALTWLGWRFAQVAEDRARVIRRRPDEGEPIIVLGDERWGLPLRAFGPVVDATPGKERVPQLSSIEVQEATTMRQQTANALQARLSGEIARAKAKIPTQARGRHRQLQQSSFKPAQLRTPSPGLVNVVALSDLAEAMEQGVLNPQLAHAIEGQWTAVS
ncbi:MAG: hypothetical protein GY832_05580 [Chloroflexi bacterium]|nr:hypothetical protein [Chloroflexota bacterium]